MTVFDDIAYFFKEILSLIYPPNFWAYMKTHALNPIFERAKSEIVKDLKDQMQSMQDSIAGQVGAKGQGVQDRLWEIKDSTKDGWANRVPALGSAVRGGLDGVNAAISIAQTKADASLRALQDAVAATKTDDNSPEPRSIRELKDTTKDSMQGLSNAFAAKLNELRGGLEVKIAEQSGALKAGMKEVADVSTVNQLALAQQVSKSVADLANTLKSPEPGGLQGKLLDARDATFAFVEDWFGKFKDLPAKYFSFIADSAGTDLALEPERALDMVGRLYSMSIGAGSAAHIVSAVLNIIPTLNWVGASQLAGYISQVAGFDEITKASYGTLLNSVINWPLQYHWNKLLRPRIPTEGSIYAMGRKRGLDRREFGKAMAMQGLPDEWIDKEYLFFWADPSPQWLLRMSESGTPPFNPSGAMRGWVNKWMGSHLGDTDAWFRMKLLMAGFEDTDIEPFLSTFRRRAAGPALTQTKTSIRAMLRGAYWSPATATSALQNIGVRQDEISQMIIAEDLSYQNSFLDDQIVYYTDQFRKGQISTQAFSLALSTIIVKPERVAQIVADELVRLLPKPKSIVDVVDDPLVQSVRTQAINSWLKAYRGWLITVEDLLLGLTLVVQDAKLAQSMLDAELSAKRPAPPVPAPAKEDPLAAAARRASIASWVKQFRDGLIDARQLDQVLLALITNAELRKSVIDLESLRYFPAPDIQPPAEEDDLLAEARELAVAGHIKMFASRVIPLDQLYAFLLADGLTQALAKSTCISQSQRRIVPPSLDSSYFTSDVLQQLYDAGIAEYEKMYVAGSIQLDTYRLWLIEMGVDADVVAYLADGLELRRFTK